MGRLSCCVSLPQSAVQTAPSSEGAVGAVGAFSPSVCDADRFVIRGSRRGGCRVEHSLPRSAILTGLSLEGGVGGGCRVEHSLPRSAMLTGLSLEGGVGGGYRVVYLSLGLRY